MKCSTEQVPVDAVVCVLGGGLFEESLYKMPSYGFLM